MRLENLKFIFLSSEKYPPFRVDTTVLFGEELTSRGHEIVWLLQSGSSCDRAYKANWNGQVVWVGETDQGIERFNRLRKHVLNIIHKLKLFKLLKESRYDFIQVKDEYIMALAAALGARIYRTKFIFWLSYPHAEESLFKVREGVARYPVFYFIRGHFLKFITYKIIMRLASHVFVQSEQMKKDLTIEGVPISKMTPVPMGVSLKDFERYRIVEKISGNNKRRKKIVYLGTLQSARKMDFMVRVLNIVLKSEPDALLYFVGDGDDRGDRETIEKAAEDLGLSESIVITGFIPRADAMRYVREADVCVSPFFPDPILNSTSPTKIIEYMAMEKPVVANEHPEQRLLIVESGGGICVPYDEAAFAEAIVELLMDAVKAKEMGWRGRKYVEENRDYKKIADVVEGKYFELFSESKCQVDATSVSDSKMSDKLDNDRRNSE